MLNKQHNRNVRARSRCYYGPSIYILSVYVCHSIVDSQKQPQMMILNARQCALWRTDEANASGRTTARQQVRAAERSKTYYKAQRFCQCSVVR